MLARKAATVGSEHTYLPFNEVGNIVDPGHDICGNRHKGNAESAEAHRRVVQTKKALWKRIYNYVLACRANGSTVEELAIRLKLRYSTVSARVSELKCGVLIDGTTHKLVESGERRKTTGGSTAAVLVAQLPVECGIGAIRL